jgi:hypothetical protein
MSLDGLPGRFGDARDFAIGGELSEANAADSKEADESVSAAAESAAVINACGEFRFFALGLCLEECLKSSLLADHDGFASHERGLRGGKVGGFSRNKR